METQEGEFSRAAAVFFCGNSCEIDRNNMRFASLTWFAFFPPACQIFSMGSLALFIPPTLENKNL